MNSKLFHTLGYGAALVLLLLFGRFWLNEYVGRMKAENEQKIIDARDKAQAEESAKFEKIIAELKTPEQAAPIIRTIFLPAPGQKPSPNQNIAAGAPISVPRGSLSPEVQAKLPDAPTGKSSDPVDLLTPAQQVVLAKRETACEKAEGELTTCKADKENMKNQINDLQGGTKWQRVVKEAKCLGFLGGGAAIGAKVGGWKGAAIGGVGGEVGCKIFF